MLPAGRRSGAPRHRGRDGDGAIGGGPAGSLARARVASAKFWTEARPVVFTLEPGEAAVIPRGWWHYAVAIDHGWTVMRNFYHAGTNAAALVRAIAGKLDRERPRRS